MSKIIKIEPVPKYYSITWMLGSLCNYSCSYCPDELHDTTSRPHDLETLKTAWKNVYQKTQHLGLKYKISLTGGEVTANKNFLPFITWLKSEYNESIAMLIVTSNGSASVNYYKKLANLVEAISFSTHSEFMDEQAFFNKVLKINQIMIPPKKSLHVNVMDEYWNKDRIEIYRKWLEKHRINYSINEIIYSLGTRKIYFNKGKSNLGKS
jgi:molybdenum cofactor biosynthesis enzyme MoaA